MSLRVANILPSESLESFNASEVQDMMYFIFFDLRTWGSDLEKSCVHYCGYVYTVFSELGNMPMEPVLKAYEKYGDNVAWRFTLLVTKDEFSGDGFPYIPLDMLTPFLSLPNMASTLASRRFHVLLAQRVWAALKHEQKATLHACKFFVITLHEYVASLSLQTCPQL